MYNNGQKGIAYIDNKNDPTCEKKCAIERLGDPETFTLNPKFGWVLSDVEEPLKGLLETVAAHQASLSNWWFSSLCHSWALSVLGFFKKSNRF